MTICSVTDYRRVTLDLGSDAAAVLDALADAQGLLEDELERSGVMESATRTEEVRVYNLQNTYVFLQGLAYPKATPITSVVSPAGVTFTASEIRGISGTVFDLVTDLVNEFPRTTVTYVGGWTNASYPHALRRANCLVARELLAVPAAASGAISVTAGDVHLSYAKPSTPGTGIAAILADPLVQRWRRRRPMR